MNFRGAARKAERIFAAAGGSGAISRPWILARRLLHAEAMKRLLPAIVVVCAACGGGHECATSADCPPLAVLCLRPPAPCPMNQCVDGQCKVVEVVPADAGIDGP